MKANKNSIRPRDEPSKDPRKPVKKVKPEQSSKRKKNNQKHRKTGKADTKINPLEQAFTWLAKAFVKKSGTKFLAMNFPYVFFAYFGNKIGYSYRVAKAPDFFNRMMEALQNLGGAFTNIFPSIHPFDLIIGIITGIGMYLVVFFKKKNAKKFRKGVEYGSARWGTEKDIYPFMDHENLDNNIILTQTEGMIMNGKPKGPKYDRNRNVLIIGGSGSGKTRFFVKPNLMQLHSSYCVTDPKGYI